MIKNAIRQFAQRCGLYLATTGRLGIDVDLDLARLSSMSPIKTIFDVGANFGQTAQRYARAFPSAAIFSFEPVPSSFEKLQTAVKHLAKVQIFNLALGDQVEQLPINISCSPGSSSLKEIQAAESTVNVRVETLDRICNAQRVQAIDLLKIDVEGFELAVLRGAQGQLSEGNIRFIYAECVFSPNSEMPHSSYFELHEFLSARGFCFVSYYAESFNLRLGCALGNVLYALRKELPAHVSGRINNIA